MSNRCRCRLTREIFIDITGNLGQHGHSVIFIRQVIAQQNNHIRVAGQINYPGVMAEMGKFPGFVGYYYILRQFCRNTVTRLRLLQQTDNLPGSVRRYHLTGAKLLKIGRRISRGVVIKLSSAGKLVSVIFNFRASDCRID